MNMDRPDNPELVNRQVIVVGHFKLDVAKGEAWSGERPVSLTRVEATLLAALLRQRGRVVTRTELMIDAWSDVRIPEERLAQEIAGLRAKLVFCQIEITTVPGIGYVLR